MSIHAIAENIPEWWFEHPITVFPYCTDYGGMIYLAWNLSTLVPIDRKKGKIMRQLPLLIKQALTKLSGH